MHVTTTAAALAVLLAAATAFEAPNRDLRPQHGLELLQMMAERPWIGLGPHNHWNRPPRIETDMEPKELEVMKEVYDNGDSGINVEDLIRTGSDKRSAVATALNAGRRRRQPTPALGKAVTPFVGVGVLNDMETFFDSLKDNLETLASLSPEQRTTFFQGPPTVVQAPAYSSGGGGGGSGIRKLHALRPLRPTGNIRAYNRRSFVEAEDYPGANHHDPGLLWTGLGR